MPAVSVKQRQLMGIAHAIKTGKLSKSYSKKAAKVAKNMKAKELRHFAETKEKGLPKKAKKRT